MSQDSPSADRGAAHTYVFPIELFLDTDGRWSATCPALPGCATWARSRDEAIHNIQEATEAYIADLIAAGENVPDSVRKLDHVAVTVTV